jgi:Ras family protein T1
MIGLIALGATSITAVIGVWMRYQGYTLRGIWAWMGRTTGIFGARAA